MKNRGEGVDQIEAWMNWSRVQKGTPGVCQADPCPSSALFTNPGAPSPRTLSPLQSNVAFALTAPPASPPRAPPETQYTPAQPYNSPSDRPGSPRCHQSLCLYRRASTPTPPRCRPDRKSTLRHHCPCRQSCPLPSAAAQCGSVPWPFPAASPYLPDWVHTRPSNRAYFHSHDSRTDP